MSVKNIKSTKSSNDFCFKITVINARTYEFKEKILILTAKTPRDYLIGRHDSCDLVLDSIEVSRIHGRICFQYGQCFYTDLGSTDGSQINERQLEVNQIYLWQQNSLLRIGSYVLAIAQVNNLDNNAQIQLLKNN